MKTETLFSHERDDWPTPQWLFDELNEEFHFDMDPCATAENAKCINYYTAADDGLEKNWGGGTESSATHRTPTSPHG